MPLLEEISVGNSVVKIYDYTNRGKPVLALVYHWAGERKQRMMRNEGPKDVKEARRRAKELAGAMHNGRSDVLMFTSDEHRTMKAARDALATISDISVDAACREYAQAKEIIGDTGTLLDAATYYRKSRPSSVKSLRVSLAVEEYIAALVHDKLSIRYIQDARHRLRRFAGDFEVPLAEVTTADLNRWLRGLGVSPRSRNNYRTALVTFSHWAQEQGYLRRDVKTEFDALKIVKAPTTIHIWTPDHAATLLESAEKLANSAKKDEQRKGLSCLHYLVLGSFPGVRPQEIMRLEGSNIRFQHNDIEILPAQAKGQRHRPGRRRLVPIQPNVRAWLETYPPPETGRLVMFKTPQFVRALAKKAKVEWHHDIMRHSAISYAVAATGNVDLVALWSGNSRDVIYESYLNQVTPAEAMAYGSIMPKLAAKNVIRLGKHA